MVRIIDLCMKIYEGMPYLDTISPFKIVHNSKVEKNGFELTDISMSSHTGTHLDAPLHYIEKGETVDKIDCNKIVGKATVFDVSYIPLCSPITTEYLERCPVHLSEGDVAVIYTGCEKLLGQSEYFSDFPFLTKEAAKWLVHKGSCAIGVDTPSVDSFSAESSSFEAHKILLGACVCVIESLVNVKLLLKGGPYLFLALPLKIVGAEASPVRAVAIEMS